MLLRKSFILLFILLPALGASALKAHAPGTSVTGHASVKIESAGANGFSAKCMADFVLKDAVCKKETCEEASMKALDMLVARFSNKEGLKVQLLPQCECSSGDNVNWTASCDKLKGLARQLCYARSQ